MSAKKIGPRRGPTARAGKGKPSRTGKSLALPLMPAMLAFVRWYLVRRNVTRAYMSAYPNASYETARTEGSRLFRDPRISSRIKELLREEAKRLESRSQKVSDSLASMAFSNIADVFTDEGLIRIPTDMDRDVAAGVKKMKRREIVAEVDGTRQVIGHTIEVEMHDRVAPLRLLGLELGMFTEKVEHTADDAILAAIKAGRERALAGE